MDETGSWAGKVSARGLFITEGFVAQPGAATDPSCVPGLGKRVVCDAEKECLLGGGFTGKYYGIGEKTPGGLTCAEANGKPTLSCEAEQCRLGDDCRDIGQSLGDLLCSEIDGKSTFTCKPDQCRWENEAVCVDPDKTRNGRTCLLIDGKPVFKQADGTFCSANDACASGSCAPSITVAELVWNSCDQTLTLAQVEKNTKTYGASSGPVCSPVGKCVAIVNSICGSSAQFVPQGDVMEQQKLTCTADSNGKNLRWIPAEGSVCKWEGGRPFNAECAKGYTCAESTSPLLLTHLCCKPGQCVDVGHAGEVGKCRAARHGETCPTKSNHAISTTKPLNLGAGQWTQVKDPFMFLGW